MLNDFLSKLKKTFPISVKDMVLSFIILSVSFALCFLIRVFDPDSTVSIPILFILAVFLISRYTNGYFFGAISTLISVLGVNYVFTYPYFAFNFTLSGYPVTIISTLSVSIITSTLTTRIKYQERLKSEAEAEKMRSNLLRSVSHDLRTPLTTILGSSSAIIENNSNLSEESKLKLVSEIKDDAQWLIQMVENLLSITRISGSRNTKIIKTTESVEEVIADSVHKFRKRYPGFHVAVAVPSEPLFAPMDAILIEQVITNILENAVIHSKTATKAEIKVLSKDNSVVFEITDNGVGISKDAFLHLFDGYLVHSDDKGIDSKKNMGIGLSVCYTIIKAHDGNMLARNIPNSGASFIFTLPTEEK